MSELSARAHHILKRLYPHKKNYETDNMIGSGRGMTAKMRIEKNNVLGEKSILWLGHHHPKYAYLVAEMEEAKAQSESDRTQRVRDYWKVYPFNKLSDYAQMFCGYRRLI